MKHLTIIVLGKVQGVFFRASVMEEAVRLGVNGFVCNLSDGSVCVEAEGTEEQLHALTAWCHKGSSRSTVIEIKVTEGKLKNFSRFEIRR